MESSFEDMFRLLFDMYIKHIICISWFQEELKIRDLHIMKIYDIVIELGMEMELASAL